MKPTSEQFDLLELVARFSGYRRYGGVMPLPLVALKNGLVDSLLANKILTHKIVRCGKGYRVDGVCLTDFGRRLLRTS